MASILCGFFNSPGGIAKINLDTFAKKSYLATSSGETDIEWMAKDGKFAYLACYVDPGIIVKMNLATNTRVGKLTLESGERDLFGVAIKDRYLYTTSAAEMVIKVDLNDFTRVGKLDLASDDPASIHIKDGFAYIVHYSNPAGVAKIDLSDFSIDTETTHSGEKNYTCGIIHGDYLYAGTVESPGKIHKIKLSDLSLDSTLTLTSGRNRVECLTVWRNFLYAGLHTEIGETNPPPYVAKVDLSDFSEVGVITHATHRAIWGCVAVDNYLYLGDYAAPAKIHKVDLSDFSDDSTLSLTGDDEDLMSRNLLITEEVTPRDVMIRVIGHTHRFDVTSKWGTYESDIFLGGYIESELTTEEQAVAAEEVEAEMAKEMGSGLTPDGTPPSVPPPTETTRQWTHKGEIWGEQADRPPERRTRDPEKDIGRRLGDL